MYFIDKCMKPIRMDIEISICVRYYFNYKAKAKVICNKSLIHKYARTLVLKLQSIKSSNMIFWCSIGGQKQKHPDRAIASCWFEIHVHRDQINYL